MKLSDNLIHLRQLVIDQRFHIATDLTPHSLKIHGTLGIIDMERVCEGTLCDSHAGAIAIKCSRHELYRKVER